MGTTSVACLGSRKGGGQRRGKPTRGTKGKPVIFTQICKYIYTLLEYSPLVSTPNVMVIRGINEQNTKMKTAAELTNDP